jgi:4-amino-4-deoxy-L-arabinose transferase-like glycosyltransferase
MRSPGDENVTRMSRLSLLVIAALAFVVGISNAFTPRPLETHEVFVAQTAREMLAAHEWVLPTFNAEPRLNKPPLAYWLVMGLERVFPSVVPVPEWKARLPSAVAAAVVAVFSALVAFRLYRCSRTALLAGLLVAASSGVFRYGNNARPEMLYAAACSLMLWGVVESASAMDRSGRQTVFAALIWIGAALAILAKGPHFPALILVGVVVHAVIAGEHRRLVSVLRPYWGLPLMLAISLPWVLAVMAKAPTAGVTWFEQISDAPDRGERSWAELFAPYYLWGLPQIILPWAVLLPFGLASPFSRSVDATLKNGRVLLWVFAVVFVALSVTTHRRSYYMLPMLAALAPLAAAGTLDAVGKLRAPWNTRLTSVLWLACGLAIATLAWLGTQDWVWGRGGAAKQAFADTVAGTVGAEPVLLLGERPGLITYRLNRTTPVADSASDLPTMMGGHAAWLVLPPSRLSELPPTLTASAPAAQQSTGESAEDRVLIHLIPSNDP